MPNVMAAARVLLLSDTHLGLDLPDRPRVERRRRGHDFADNFLRALQPALEGRVHAVVHGGDLFYRSQLPAWLVESAAAPLRDVADRGIPVLLVPGNHERSHLPHGLLLAHRHIHVFDRPRTYALDVGPLKVAFSGFPYQRDGVRLRFAQVLEQTGWRHAQADAKVLCVHHCVEGATVGPGNYVFRTAEDVIQAADLPAGFAAVFSGHIHRAQVLTADLRGQPLPAPVLYPGSVERTSFAEKDEPKGYLLVDLLGGPPPSVTWHTVTLPARPMLQVDVDARRPDLEEQVRNALAHAPPDAILQLRVQGVPDQRGRQVLTAASLRSLAPEMNVTVVQHGMARANTIVT